MTPQECLQIDSVQEEIANAAAAAGVAAQRRTRDSIEAHMSAIESPIEAIFYAWWCAFQGVMSPYGTFLLDPQLPVTACGNSYRLDFAIRSSLESSRKPLIAVELDGHDFHERTPEQVERRNARDRDLQHDGWKIFHFSGREVKLQPLKCVAEVYGYALLDRFQASSYPHAQEQAEKFIAWAIEDMGF